jgi:acyl-CoA synthetase (AMP-forming)/AMP-acid ligase II
VSGAAQPDHNIASHLQDMARRMPDRPALIRAAGGRGGGRGHDRSWSFAQLEDLTNRLAGALCAAGIDRGARTLVMIPPGLNFLTVIFGLFKIGAVPVLVDPRMGLRAMLGCVRQAAPQALIGVPLAAALRLARPASFSGVNVVISAGRRWFGGLSLSRLLQAGGPAFQPRPCRPQEPAAILFTSGSTGPPKGVVYEHGMFAAQVQALRAEYHFEPGESKLATFPLFALFCPGLGLTCILPQMDSSRPAQADPAKILRALHDHRPASAFGSPALWSNLLAHCGARRARLPGLRRLLIAGAPVPGALVEGLRALLDEGADIFTPYGATEALPVSSISGRELQDGCIAASRRGQGICVGRPVAATGVRVIAPTEGPIPAWSEELALPPQTVGEIVVCGPVVTRCYHAQPQATAAAKIADGDRIWHRMGDLGYLDQAGRLWYCGRKAHRVQTAGGALDSMPCEVPLEEHPLVRRCALVGVGPRDRHTPVIVVQPRRRLSRRQRRRLICELRQAARACETTRSIERFVFKRRLPVDRRHNAKIDRQALALWAEKRTSTES